MLLAIDFSSDVAIYEQIVRQVVIGVAKGKIKKGEILPSVRQLASDIGVNLHTVNKAYKELRDLGYVEMDRRWGSKIYDVIEPYENLAERVGEGFLFLVSDVKNRNYKKEDLLKMVEKIYEEMEGEDE